MTWTLAQALIGVISALLAGVVGVLRYFKYRTKRDQIATVGASFVLAVESLASDNETKRMVGAVLLRRFFDRRTEQGAIGTPYAQETIQVIAGMLREPLPDRLQKVLADGLRYAPSLMYADLQRCNLKNAYLGSKHSKQAGVELSFADLFESNCTAASFRSSTANGAVFFRANAENAVFNNTDLSDADFRLAHLKGAQFFGARIAGADFTGARDVPPQVSRLLNVQQIAPPNATVENS